MLATARMDGPIAISSNAGLACSNRSLRQRSTSHLCSAPRSRSRRLHKLSWAQSRDGPGGWRLRPFGLRTWTPPTLALTLARTHSPQHQHPDGGLRGLASQHYLMTLTHEEEEQTKQSPMPLRCILGTSKVVFGTPNTEVGT